MPKYPATFFKKATEADVLIDPQNPTVCQLSLTADGSDIHVYQISREILTQLGRRIEQSLADVPIPFQK